MKKFYLFWITKGKLRDRIILTSLFFLVIIALVIIGYQLWIQMMLHRSCTIAQQKYHQTECVFALISQLEDSSIPPENRNIAARMLGYLGKRDALPALKQFNLEIDEKCNPRQELCGTEVSKAILRIETDQQLWTSTRIFFENYNFPP